MVPCQRCGAMLELGAPSCPYCGTRTAHGYALEQQRAAQSWHSAEQARASNAADRARAEEEVKKQARIGLIATILAFVFCCAPISIVGLVLSVRAKANAKKYALIAPASSTVGLILGIFGTLSTVGFWAYLPFFSAQEDERRAELQRHASDQTLTKDTACELVRARLNSGGFGSEPYIISSTCNGTFAQRGDRAFLDGVNFRAGKKEVSATVCFQRSARWEITDLRADQRCSPTAPSEGKRRERD